MNLFRYVRWLCGFGDGLGSLKLALQITYSGLCSLVPPLFIVFVISLQKQIIDQGGNVNSSDVELLVIATLFALTFLISSAFVAKNTDDELNRQWSQYFKIMLGRYMSSQRSHAATSEQIEFDLERLDSVSNLLGRQAYLVRGAVATSIFFIPLAFFIQGPIAFVSLAFMFITLVRLEQIDRHQSLLPLKQQWCEQIRFQSERQEWITHLSDIVGLLRNADKILARISNHISHIQQRERIQANKLSNDLSSLAQFERISMITFGALGIAFGSLDRSIFIVIILLAGRFTQPLREVGFLWLRRSRELSGFKLLSELSLEKTENPICQIRSTTAIIGASVLDNLTLGENHLKDRAIEMAEMTNLSQWVESLPSGYLTVLEEDTPFIPHHIRQLIGALRIITISNGSEMSLNMDDCQFEVETIEALNHIIDMSSIQKGINIISVPNS